MKEVDRKSSNLKKFKPSSIWQSILLVYITSIMISWKYSSVYSETFVPQGDPYTYLNSWLRLSSDLNENFIDNFHQIFTNNWYWSQNIGVGIFSFIFEKNWNSFFLVNHLFAFFATVGIYNFLRNKPLNEYAKIFLCLIPLTFPGLRGFKHISSIELSALDSSFVSLTLAMYFSTLAYFMDLKNRPKALIASAFTILAFWARGNSIYFVLIILAPLFLLLFQSEKRKEVEKSFFYLYLFPTATMVLFYYQQNYKSLSTYYGVHREVSGSKKSIIDFESLRQFIYGVPGSFVTFNDGNLPTLLFSFFGHLCILLMIIYVGKIYSLKHNEVDRVKQYLLNLTLLNSLLYPFVFLLNGIAFTGLTSIPIQEFHLALKGALTAWSPILFILIVQCVVFSTIIGYQRSDSKAAKFPLRKFRKGLKFVLVIVISLTLIITQISQNQPLRNLNTIPPKTVASFANEIDQYLVENNRKVCFLSYGLLNRPLIDFYRLASGESPVDIHIDANWFELWSQNDYSEEKGNLVKLGLESQFENCMVIVVPELLSYMNPMDPYSIYKFPDIYVASVELHSQEFVVVATLRETQDQRLLILKRRTSADNGYPLLKTPYGDQRYDYEVREWR